MEIDGHSMDEILVALDWAVSIENSPCAIVAKTVKGKGVSFMEGNPAFHGKAPDDDELQIALEELS
jgi:transketolase